MTSPSMTPSDMTDPAMPTSLPLALEAIVIPVSDVDRAKRFYVEDLGFRMDIDQSATAYEKAVGFRYRGAARYRIVQLTPPGSSCSIQFGEGITHATPGSYEGLYLITSDLEAARAALVARGVAVSEPSHYGPDGQVPGFDPNHTSYNSFLTFRDPDGNGWLMQEVTARLPGRIEPGVTSFGSAGDLASAMRRAATAHGEHEKRIGAADPNWPAWYAEYMVAEQAGTELPK